MIKNHLIEQHRKAVASEAYFRDIARANPSDRETAEAMAADFRALADTFQLRLDELNDTPTEPEMPAHKGLKTPAGVTTAQNLAPQSTLLKAIGSDGLEEIFVEDKVVDANKTSLSWDGSKFTLAYARNAWVYGVVAIESVTGGDQQFTAAIAQMTRQGGGSIQNTSTAYADHALRPLQLFHPGNVPINGLSYFAADTYQDKHKAPRYQSTANPPNAATREALGKSKPNGVVDMTIAGDTQIVPGGQTYVLWFRVWVSATDQAGVYDSAITLTDSAGGVVTLPIELTVDSTILDSQNDIPVYSYVSMNVAGERATGTLFPATTAQETQQSTMTDEICKLARSCRVTPLLDEDGDNPVPTPAHEARILGSLYSGNGYIGPGVNEQLDVMFLGMYGQWRNWSGIGGVAAADAMAANGDPSPAALVTHLANFEAWRAANFNGDVYAYMADEAHIETLVPIIDKHAEWFNPYKSYVTTGSALASPVPNFEYWIANAPNVDHISIAAPCMPKNSGDQLKAWVDQGKESSIYNGIGPMTCSNQLDEIQAGLHLNQLGFQKLKTHDGTQVLHGYLIWGFNEWRNNEGGGVFTGAPTGTYVDGGDNRGRPNLWRTGHSMGQNDINVDRSFDGHSGYLYCEGDGHLCIPLIDAFGPAFAAAGGNDDSFGIESAAPTVRLFQLNRAIQDAQLAAQARAVDGAAVDADLASLIPTFAWELGVTNDGLPNQERSYNNAPNPLHSISTDSIVEFERAQLARAV